MAAKIDIVICGVQGVLISGPYSLPKEIVEVCEWEHLPYFCDILSNS